MAETTNKVDEKEEEFKDWNPDDTDQTGDGDESWELDSSIDHAWDAAEEKKGFDDVPPASYDVVVEKVEKRTSQAGNKMLSYTMSILEGELKGRKLFKNHVFTSPKSLPYIKGDFSILGIPLVPPLSEAIPAAIEKVLGMMIKVKVRKQKDGEGVNVDFKEYLGRMDGESVEE